MSGFPTGLWGSRREAGETLRNRESISNAGSLTSNLKDCKASKRQHAHVFMYIHIHSVLISCDTSESYIRHVIATWQGSELCKGLPALHIQNITVSSANASNLIFSLRITKMAMRGNYLPGSAWAIFNHWVIQVSIFPISFSVQFHKFKRTRAEGREYNLNLYLWSSQQNYTQALHPVLSLVLL